VTIVVISGRIGVWRGCRRPRSWPPATRTYALEVGEHGGRDSLDIKDTKERRLNYRHNEQMNQWKG
jgi:hypothetical protein